MCNALGIVNLRRVELEGIGEWRPLGATSFLGRYRLIDFILSNFTNSDIDQIQVYIKDKPRSLIEHIGSGQQYDINTKHGNIRLLGLERRLPNEAYNTDINAFAENMRFIESAKKDYVIIAPCNFIFPIDFNEVLNAHKASGADVTVIYKAIDNARDNYLNCECVTLNAKKEIVSFDYNRGNANDRNVSLETYVMKLDVFKQLIKDAQETSMFYHLQDILHDRVDRLAIMGYPYKQPSCCINSLSSYYRANMVFKNPDIIKGLNNKNWPLYTSTGDSAPVKYGSEAIVEDSLIANGCYIKGTVINSILGRGVVVEEGAVVKDCIVMAESTIGVGTHIEHAVVDKFVKVIHKTTIKSTTDEPLYIKKFDVV